MGHLSPCSICAQARHSIATTYQLRRHPRTDDRPTTNDDRPTTDDKETRRQGDWETGKRRDGVISNLQSLISNLQSTICNLQSRAKGALMAHRTIVGIDVGTTKVSTIVAQVQDNG